MFFFFRKRTYAALVATDEAKKKAENLKIILSKNPGSHRLLRTYHEMQVLLA